MKIKIFICFVLCLFSNRSHAQMPETHIYLINYFKDGNNLKTTDIFKISESVGYNNQPSFSTDCKQIYYTSNIADSLQTDLYAYDISKRKSNKISNTNLSEYSPMIQPGAAFALSYVRVEVDKKQNLRSYSADYSSPKNLVPCSDSIGYYVWSDSSNLGLIILNNGLEFHTYRLGDPNTKLVANKVGRFLNYNGNSKDYVFLDKDSTLETIKYFNTKSRIIEKTIQTLNDCEDYAIDSNSDIFGSNGGRLFQYNGSEWELAADLTKQIGPFYRMNFCNCGRHLCVVSYNGKKP